MNSNTPKEPPQEQRRANWLGSRVKVLTTEVTGLIISREKQKQMFATSLYRNALYLVINNLAGPLTSFLFWIIVARFYSTSAVGLASAVASIVTLLGLFSTFGFEFGLIRYLANAGHNANSMVNTSLTLGSIVAIIFSCIFLTGVSIWSPALAPLRQSTIYFIIFVIFTVVTTVTILMGNAFVAQRRAHFTMINNLTSSVLELIMVLLFILFLRSFRGIFFAMVFSGAITLIISMRFFLPKILPGFRPVPIISRSVVREMIHFSFTNYIANAVWSFTIYVLPIMVINALGIQANAYFFISWTVGGVLGTISLATTTSLFAEGSFDEKKMVSDIWRCLKLTCIILIPIAVIVFLLADKLLLLFGTAYSLEGTGLLRIMCIAALPLALNSIYMSILRIQKKSIALILLTVFIAIVTLVVSYFLVPRVGIIGTGFGWLISQGVLAIFVLSRLVKLKKQDNLQ